VSFGRNVDETVRLQPRRNPAPDIIVDPVALGPLQEQLPEALLRWWLDGPCRIEIRLLNEEPASRLEAACHPRHDRAAFGQMVQQRADRNEVERRAGRLVIHDIECANLKIAARNPVHQVGMDVGRNHMAGRTDLLRKPLRQRTVARADLEASPPRRHARPQQMKPARRIEHVRHQPQPVALALKIMLPDIGGHGSCPATHVPRRRSSRQRR